MPPPTLIERKVSWRLTTSLFVIGVIVLVMIALVVRGSLSRSTPRTAPPLAATSARLGPADLLVETHRVVLPAEYVGVRDWTVPRRWVLHGYDRARATELLRDVSGAAESLQCDPNGCTLWPTSAALLALSPESRTRLYSVLAEMRENPQADDAFHRTAAEGPFSTVTDLPPGAARWVDAFTWDVNGVHCFSDISSVCSRLQDHDACNAFVRTMLSRRSATIRLRLRSPGVIERAVAEFVPERQAEVRETLTAAIARGETTFMLSVFMPAWARARLRTFPTPDEDWTNCFWTALNFVNRAPGVIGNYAELEAVLGTDFDRVTGPTRFGDIMVLRASRNRPIHAATVLVAGYVFTKNGFGHLQAWRIVPTTQVTADFPATTSIDYWRVRSAAAVATTRAARHT